MSVLSDAFELYIWKHKQEGKALENIIEQISRECKMNVKFFLFFDIPDFLIKKTLPKKDLENAISLLNHAKEEYLKGKAEALKKPITEVKMTEDDLVPLDILSFVLQKRKERIDWEHNFLIDFLWECQGEINQKVKDLKVENDKIKKVIESNVSINFMNRNFIGRWEESFWL